MFSIVNRYIANQVILAVLMVLLVVVGLDTLSRVVEQTGALREGFDFIQLMHYIALTTPGRLVEYMPYAALIGCLAAIGLLANNNELIVMRAAGMSITRLLSSVLLPVLILMLISMLVAELAVPKLNQMAERQRTQQRFAAADLFVEHDFWSREGDEFIRIDRLGYDGSINGLSRYQFNEQRQLLRAQYANSANYLGDDKGEWQLMGVKETHIDHENKQTQVATLDTENWKTDLTPSLLEYLIFDPDELSMVKIYNFRGFLQEQGLNTEHYDLAFWSKLFYPFIAISLILIALPSIFGSTRQKSIGYRIFVGVVIGVLFRMFQNLMTPVALVYDFQPFLAGVLPIAICFAIGAYRLSRVR